MLGVLLHAPRGPFYSPKAARSRWRSTWKAILTFCRVAHRTTRAPPDMNSSCPVLDLLPFLAKLTVGSSDQLAHRTLSGAHRTVRCDHPTVGLATCRPLIAQTTVGRRRRWLTGQSGAHRTVRCTPDSPVNFSRGVLGEYPRATSSSPDQPGHRTVRCTTGWWWFWLS
jgi:hypothetical protein